MEKDGGAWLGHSYRKQLKHEDFLNPDQRDAIQRIDIINNKNNIPARTVGDAPSVPLADGMLASVPPPPPAMPRTPLIGALPKTTSAVSYPHRDGAGDKINLRDQILSYLIESTFGVNEYLCDNEDVPAAIAGRFEAYPNLKGVWEQLREDAAKAPFPLAPSPSGTSNKKIDASRWVPSFIQYAPSRFGEDVFRRYQSTPAFVQDMYNFEDQHNILSKAWDLTRKNLGYHGDCRYAWEKFLDASFAEQMQQAAEIDIVYWPETPETSEARAQLEIMTPTGVHHLAAQLNGRDTAEILTWGENINRQRAQAFKQSHDLNIRDINAENGHIHAILKDYESLLRARTPGRLRSFFARLMHDPLESALENDLAHRMGVPPPVDPRNYRFYTPAQKMARGEVIIDQIESYYTTAAPEQLARFLAAEQSENLAHDFADLTGLYASALKKNRTRLTGEGAQPETVDTRIAELERARAVCEREGAHFTASAALHLEMRTRMREILDITLPAYRAQMQTAYLQALGKQALSAEFAKEALGGATFDKTRAAELANNLEKLADQVRDLAGLQQAMSNNEKLVLEHKQPIALEYQKVLALPAPAPDAKDSDPAPV